MTFENTGIQEEQFLLFSSGGISYVLSLSEVGQIVAEVPEEMPRVLLPGQQGGGSCAIIFQDGKGLAALAADHVSGIVLLPPSCQYEMPAETRSPGNRWIQGVAFPEGSGGLCFLVDCRRLRERFYGSREDG